MGGVQWWNTSWPAGINLKSIIGAWTCFEYKMQISGSNIVLTEWINGAQTRGPITGPGQDATGDFHDIAFSGWENTGANYTADHYIDDIVVADSYIGCTGSSGGGDTGGGSGSGSGGGDTSASGGSGCGFVKDNNGKGQKAKGEGLALMIMLIIALVGTALLKRGVVMKKGNNLSVGLVTIVFCALLHLSACGGGGNGGNDGGSASSSSIGGTTVTTTSCSAIYASGLTLRPAPTTPPLRTWRSQLKARLLRIRSTVPAWCV